MTRLPAGVRERVVAVGDVELHVLEAGTSGPLVVLAHGFPELAWSWRRQLPVLADAGYRVIAPDQRGYGGSSRPAAIEDYDIFHLTGDLAGLLDALDEEQATFVGHDWGAMAVWQLALLHPTRVRGVAALSVPYVPRATAPPTERFRAIFGDAFFYILYFQEPGIADADLGADPARTLRRMFAGLPRDVTEPETVTSGEALGFVDRMPEPDRLPDWLPAGDLDHYISEFRRTGFTGGLNWYRNFDRNWALTPHLDGAHVTVPSLFIGGSADPVLALSSPDRQLPYLDDLRGTVIVDGAGHWIQQEAADEVNRALLSFLHGL